MSGHEWEISSLNVSAVLACTHTHAHVHTLVGCQGSSGFQRVLWKVLTLANISWCVLFLFAYWVLPQPAPIVRAFYLNVNTIITAGDATAGVSLPVCFVSSVFQCLCVSLWAFPAFLPPVLFNSYHYVSAKWNPFGINFFYPLQMSLFF